MLTSMTPGRVQNTICGQKESVQIQLVVFVLRSPLDHSRKKFKQNRICDIVTYKFNAGESPMKVNFPRKEDAAGLIPVTSSKEIYKIITYVRAQAWVCQSQSWWNNRWFESIMKLYFSYCLFRIMVVHIFGINEAADRYC
jgi:hypothetical protein